MKLKKSHSLLIASSALVLSLSANQAYAFEDEDARRAILDLRSQLRQTQQNNIELNNKINNLQQQISQLRGNIETANHQARMAQQSSQQAANPDVPPSPQVGDPNEQQSYDSALDLFRQGNYAEASTALNRFAQQYPNSPLTPSARFYEGSSRYANKDFNGSIQGLQAMVAAYPRDQKAGDALLVIAGSQVELNNIAGAKATLQRVVNEYPNTPAADTARNRLELFR
ncbi:MAG TPA: tol-pal system protein YbgF [Advenella sp.]|nr:tol-pal system protein YbgF [Advenella sp.]